jgi:hypothetical protein
VLARAVRDGRSTQHAGQFLGAVRVIQDFDPRARLAVRDVLGHAQLVIRLRRNLWQVSHAQHLALAGELVQLTADHLGDGATYARVNLVEDQAGEVSGLDGRHLQRQADAREFAA